MVPDATHEAAGRGSCTLRGEDGRVDAVVATTRSCRCAARDGAGACCRGIGNPPAAPARADPESRRELPVRYIESVPEDHVVGRALDRSRVVRAEEIRPQHVLGPGASEQIDFIRARSGAAVDRR